MVTAITTTRKKAKTTATKAVPLSSKRTVKKRGDLGSCIAEAAYFKAESRGFETGHELDDWLEAETQLMGEQQTH